MTNEDAIKWLENLKNDIGNPHYEYLWPYAQAIDEIAELLKEQEAVEPVTKDRHEYWGASESMVEERVTYCNRCGTQYYIDDLLAVGETVDGVGQSALPNYCPHCGAKMKQEGW